MRKAQRVHDLLRLPLSKEERVDWEALDRMVDSTASNRRRAAGMSQRAINARRGDIIALIARPALWKSNGDATH